MEVFIVSIVSLIAIIALFNICFSAYLLYNVIFKK